MLQWQESEKACVSWFPRQERKARERELLALELLARQVLVGACSCFSSASGGRSGGEADLLAHEDRTDLLMRRRPVGSCGMWDGVVSTSAENLCSAMAYGGVGVVS